MGGTCVDFQFLDCEVWMGIAKLPLWFIACGSCIVLWVETIVLDVRFKFIICCSFVLSFTIFFFINSIGIFFEVFISWGEKPADWRQLCINIDDWWLYIVNARSILSALLSGNEIEELEQATGVKSWERLLVDLSWRIVVPKVWVTTGEIPLRGGVVALFWLSNDSGWLLTVSMFPLLHMLLKPTWGSKELSPSSEPWLVLD